MALQCVNESGEWWIVDNTDQSVVAGYFDTKAECNREKRKLEKQEQEQ